MEAETREWGCWRVQVCDGKASLDTSQIHELRLAYPRGVGASGTANGPDPNSKEAASRRCAASGVSKIVEGEARVRISIVKECRELGDLARLAT